MTEGHDVEIGMLGLVRDEQKRWWRLSFLAEEVEWAERHLATEIADARDAGWSWRRLAAATGIPPETLRKRSERDAEGGCDVAPAAGADGGSAGGRRAGAAGPTSRGPA